MRRLVAGVVAVGTCLTLVGSELAVAQAPAPVKIGMLIELSGIFARNGREALDGTRLYLDEIGGKAAGRSIELLVEDTEGKPDVGLTKARKLVERDGVHLLAGIVNSGVGLAVAGYAKENARRTPSSSSRPAPTGSASAGSISNTESSSR